MTDLNSSLFLLKKFLGGLFMPLPMAILLLLWGLLFLLRQKTRWPGFVAVLLATLVLFTVSYAPLSKRFIGGLEEQYPAYQQAEKTADYVVVLGHAHGSSERLPVTSQLSSEAIVRLVEGIRIQRLNPGSRLVLTGYPGRDEVPFPEKLKRLALDLGVLENDILIFNSPKDTAEEARIIAENFADKSLVLVTSASHMSRAIGLFRAQGLDPQPAPTYHLNRPVPSMWVFPHAETLLRSQRAWHEFLGRKWGSLIGQINKQ